MKSVLMDTRSGEILSLDIPEPELRPGGILVRTQFSAVSAGTERVKVETGEKSLLQKAFARPDLVRQVIDHARRSGIRSAVGKVQARLDTLTSLGYSCAGTVLQVGEGITEFQPGDRVACGGANYATHSEVNYVPRNLAVAVPAEVPLIAASLTTIGAIAMQGTRQAQIALGETVAIIGAGLVGVLSIQIARAAGCRVVAIDRDRQRAERAERFGAHLGICSSDEGLLRRVQEYSRYGVDAAIITAATPSTEPLELAASLLRDRGRIAIVGDVGMGVARNALYTKELSLALSRSYGPGRYDVEYEEGGCDYPIGYVRWTERRNMEAFLDLLAAGSIDVTPLLEPVYPVGQGSRAYEELRSGRSYTAILDFGEASNPVTAVQPKTAPAIARDGILRVGMIGAGGFARSVLVPAIKSCQGVLLDAVASLSGVGAESARKSCGFLRATTAAEIISGTGPEAVFIASRHDSHAHYVAAALAQGRKVFVEKPLAVTYEQLEEVRQAFGAAECPFLMVGFNRRFAAATDQIRRHFANRSEPMLVHVRVNAGFIPAEHWMHADGGRVTGELCHFVDWARAVVAQPAQSVFARALPNGARYHGDNVSVTITFADGSIASLLYLANGDSSVPKEYFEVFSEGKTARLENWKLLRLGADGKDKVVNLRGDKGHKEEIKLTVEAMRMASASPVPFHELSEVTATTLAIQMSLMNGRSIDLAGEPPNAEGATKRQPVASEPGD